MVGRGKDAGRGASAVGYRGRLATARKGARCPGVLRCVCCAGAGGSEGRRAHANHHVRVSLAYQRAGPAPFGMYEDSPPGGITTLCSPYQEEQLLAMLRWPAQNTWLTVAAAHVPQAQAVQPVTWQRGGRLAPPAAQAFGILQQLPPAARPALSDPGAPRCGALCSHCNRWAEQSRFTHTRGWGALCAQQRERQSVEEPGTEAPALHR